MLYQDVGVRSGLEETAQLHIKLAVAEGRVTLDGHVLACPAEHEGVGSSMHLGAAADMRANLSPGIASGLDQEEWAQFAALVRSRLEMELGALVGEDRR
jgi:hypothetical protein